jgi:hypothetical protein
MASTNKHKSSPTSKEHKDQSIPEPVLPFSIKFDNLPFMKVSLLKFVDYNI